MKNSGVIFFYLIFLFIIPLALGTYGLDTGILPYYLPLMVALANMLTLSGLEEFQDLYQLNPNSFLGFVSTHLVNLIALIGIMWQSINHVAVYNNSIAYGASYAVILFIVTFPLARTGMKYVLDNADEYLSKKSDYKFDKNWHLLATGLLFIVFIIGLQAILLSIVDSSGNASKVAASNKLNSLNSKIANKISLANAKGN
tara:strand:+ start:149 stop:748 length:600 start_codon:yes stop_codon:yes gene_type:complete